MAAAAREWVRVDNAAGGRSYYWRLSTGQTTWDPPAHLARQLERGEVELEVRSIPAAEDEPPSGPGPAGAPSSDWVKVQNRVGEEYWWNVRTDETAWELPPRFSGEPNSASSTGSSKVRMVNGVDGLLDLPAGIEDVTESPPTPSSRSSGSGRLRKGFVDNLSRRGKFRTKREDGSNNSSPTVHSGKGDAASKKGSFGTGSAKHLEKEIKRKMREGKGKLDAREVVSNMEIGAPFDVEHRVHVRFDRENVRLSGLPPEWGQLQFGVGINTCQRLEVAGYSERIPAVLVLLREAMLSRNGLSTEGIFRLAPSESERNAIKERLNRGEGRKALEGCLDPNVPASLIKIWFHDLQPHMLLDCVPLAELQEFKGLAERAMTSNDPTLIGPKMEKLPEPSRSVLLWLLDTLGEVAAAESLTRMTPKNLARVVSPNLYNFDSLAPMEAMLMTKALSDILEVMLLWRMRTHPPANQCSRAADSGPVDAAPASGTVSSSLESEGSLAAATSSTTSVAAEDAQDPSAVPACGVVTAFPSDREITDEASVTDLGEEEEEEEEEGEEERASQVTSHKLPGMASPRGRKAADRRSSLPPSDDEDDL